MNEFSFTDEALREPALLITDAMLAAIPAESKHEFSPGFQAKMQKLLRRARQKTHFILRRVAVIFLSVLLSAGTWLAVDTDAQAAFVRWTLEVFGDNIIYRCFGAPSDETIPDYRLGWLPGQYEIIDVLDEDDTKVIIYKMSEAKEGLIVLHYYRIDESRSFGLDGLGEGLTPEPLEVNGMTGHYYEYPGGSKSNMLLWLDDERGIVFVVDAFADRDTLLRMAESIELGDVTSAFPQYMLSWVPDGYTKTGECIATQSRTYDYSSGEQELAFSYSLAEEKPLTDLIGLDPANADAALEIDGQDAYFLSDADISNLYWLDTEANILFHLIAPESYETMVKLAERVVKLK